MIAKEIKLNDFRNFEGYHRFPIHLLNLIIGKVGVGKSTLGRIAITFCLYGYSEVPLSKLPTRWLKDPKTWVEVVFQDKKDIIVIKREIPVKITILKNGIEEMQGATNSDKQEWIIKRFGDLEYFKKFRMIDLKEGINVLEEGKTNLRKILISFHESMLNNIRESLQKKKSLYEKLNKDTAVIFKHYPSNKRMSVLENSFQKVLSNQESISKEIRLLESDYYKLSTFKGSMERNVFNFEDQKKKIESNSSCPTCDQSYPLEFRRNLWKSTVKKLNDCKVELSKISSTISTRQVAIQKLKNSSRQIQKTLDKINSLKFKMEARLKQKDYIYTNRDILLLNSALKELDKFYSFYILSCVKVLEPIINTVISKINLEMNFILTNKGDFDIILRKDKNEYNYKELSSGQRLLLSIAFQLALLLDKGDVGIILADEGFNNLDTETMVSLYEMLKELPFQIVSIVHRFEDVSREINIIDLNDYFLTWFRDKQAKEK